MIDHTNETARNSEARQSQSNAYAPSWIDRLIDAIKRLPGSGWYA